MTNAGNSTTGPDRPRAARPRTILTRAGEKLRHPGGTTWFKKNKGFSINEGCAPNIAVFWGDMYVHGIYLYPGLWWRLRFWWYWWPSSPGAWTLSIFGVRFDHDKGE